MSLNDKRGKKMNKKILGITTTVVLLAGVLFTFTHCGMPTGKSISSGFGDGASYPSDANHSTGINDSPIPETAEGQLVQQTVDVGLKGFEQILATMASLTGVDQSNGNVQRLYDDISTQLPTSNSIKNFTASSQVAILKLASEFCNEVTRSSSLRGAIWPSTNFSQRAADAYNVQRRELFIEESIANFFPQYEESDSEYLDYGQETESLILDLMSTSDNSTTTTRNIAFGVCTTLLSSLEVSTL